MVTYVRNIQGSRIQLTLEELDPDSIILDHTNPRVGFSMRQLPAEERSDEACTVLLTSQEETDALKRSIIRSGGVQEPIYVRFDRRVAEGNRRVVALRAAKEEYPEDVRFATLPAWIIPDETPEAVVRDLLNEIHVGAVRGWAPYEKALQLRALVAGGLLEDEIAERYRMTTREVQQQLRAVSLMDDLYFPITADPGDPHHRAKFSYFLEFWKNSRLRKHAEATPDLPKQFAVWVRDGKIDTGAGVRRLAKVLDSEEATEILETIGLNAAEDFLARNDPTAHEIYALLERARARVAEMTVSDLVELGQSPGRLEVVRSLHDELAGIMEASARVRKVS